MIANKLRRRLDSDEWQITIVDQDDRHHYQPGYLFLPFGTYTEKQVVRSRHTFLPDGVDFVVAEVDRIDPEASTVALTDGRSLTYDYLVIAGHDAATRPDPGMLGPEWRRSIFDFYTLEGSKALAEALAEFDHGCLVVHVTEMPIKCPVAPLEFVFLAESYLRERGIRDRVEPDLRHSAPGRLHQAGGLRAPRVDARRAEDRARVGLHGRERRQREEGPGLLRRARGPLRPPGDRPAQHGRRLRRPLGHGRRA